MTPEELFENNINLTYKIASSYKYKLDKEDFEDIYGASLVGLWKASNTYDESRSKFSTYAWACMKREININLRYIIKHLDRKETSLDALVRDTYSGDLSVEEQLGVEDIQFNRAEHREIVNKIFEGLSIKEKTILKYLMEGKRQVDISRAMGVSRSHISTVFLGVKKKYLEILKTVEK